jgi:hypothetical protein
MEESKQSLEILLGQTIAAFCYPWGAESDVGEKAIQLAQEVGFEVACSTVPRAVMREENLFWLLRVFVGDSDGKKFAQRLTVFSTELAFHIPL